jgi:hypothetical protein
MAKYHIMKGFQQFVAEKMNEQGPTAVDVSKFFKYQPSTHFQDDIPTILDALKTGKLHPIRKDMSLSKLIPTQNKVDLKKVVKKVAKLAEIGFDERHPIVVLQDGNNRYLIDGHHEAAAHIMHKSERAPMTVLSPEDVARLFPL